MTPNDTTRPTADQANSSGALTVAGVAILRIVTDAITLALWTIFLALLFLTTGWPRTAFYLLLLLGAAGYVAVTAPWLPPDDGATPASHDSGSED